MRIVVFSDTHGRTDKAIDIISKIGKVDAILHCGDMVADAEDIASIFPNIPCHYVRGNNDFYDNAPDEKLIVADGKRILITHGHYLGVRHGFGALCEKYREKNLDLLIYGHTHEGFDGYEEGCHLFNPGTAGYYPQTYGVIEIEDGKLRTAIIKF